MTAQDLHQLDSYANHTFGRVPHHLQCVGCGTQQVQRTAQGFCKGCAAKRTPTKDRIHMFKPLRPQP